MSLENPASHQPSDFPEFFGYGIITALGKGIAAQNAPKSHTYAQNHAVIIDAFEGILGTGGMIHAGMQGDVFLIKHDHPHAEHFEKGREKICPQVTRIGGKDGKKRGHFSPSFPYPEDF